MTIKIYTHKEVYEWLLNNENNGLSQHAISSTRAWAILNAPDSQSDMPLLSVLFGKENTIMGYAAIFPEKLISPDIDLIYWGSTFFLDNSLRGTGLGAKLLLELKEKINNKYITTKTPESSTRVFKKQGAKEILFEDYNIKLLQFNSHKGACKTLKALYNEIQVNNILKKIKKDNSINIEYCRFIDNKTYEFIKSNRRTDIFLRSRNTLNWILSFPFVQEAPLLNITAKNNYYFSHLHEEYNIKAFRVLKNSELIGFVMYYIKNGTLNLLYFYYLQSELTNVIYTIIKHLKKESISIIRTTNKEFYLFVKNNVAKSKIKVSMSNLCFPNFTDISPTGTFQGGDGDMFV